MIASIRGRLRRKLEDRVVIEAAGVGYEVILPPVVQQSLADAMAGDGDGADEVALEIHYHVTQNQPSPVLIGFHSGLDKEFFEKLITVKDVGPLVAARSLAAPVAEIAAAIARQDEGYLRRLPGIGPQKAKNIVAQLSSKVAKFALSQPGRAATGKAAAPPPGMDEDGLRGAVFEILTKQLGHRPSEAAQLISAALARAPASTTPEELFEEIYRGAAERRRVTDEARVMSRTALPEETQLERQLRPQRLDEYVGQRSAVESLRVSVEAARQRGEPLDHVLLSGPPGLGKTTLATILANEMGVDHRHHGGPVARAGRRPHGHPHQSRTSATSCSWTRSTGCRAWWRSCSIRPWRTSRSTSSWTRA